MDATTPAGTHGPHCTRCGVEDDSIVLNPEGARDLCATCASDADERAALAGSIYFDLEVKHSDDASASQDGDYYNENEDRPPTSPERAVGPTLPDGPAAGRAALVEQAPAPSPSSPGAGVAASPADPPLPLGSVGGAALGELRAAARQQVLDDGDALDEARALLIALSEMDPCPDCGATVEEREEEPDPREEAHEDGHACDCGVATWLRLYGSAP